MTRTHLITGAGSGIGAALARMLADRGDDLILLARSDVRGDALRQEFPGAEILVADLASPELETALSDRGPLDALDSIVHVAGTVELVPIADLGITPMLDTLMVNLVGPTALTSWALPALRATRGTAVFVNSTAMLGANPSWAAYTASKAALKAVADVLRAEEGPHGIRVTTVLPSRTATPMQEKVRGQEQGAYDPADYLDPATVAASVLSVLDLPRDATVSELVLRPAPRS